LPFCNLLQAQITGVTAGTDLTGGRKSGNVTLDLDTTKVPRLATANTFTTVTRLLVHKHLGYVCANVSLRSDIVLKLSTKSPATSHLDSTAP
jgi:hypothetical protein